MTGQIEREEPRDAMLKSLAAIGLMCVLGAPEGLAKPVLETLQDAGNFSSLIAAFRSSGLADKLRGPGAFTVLAPTDAAFAALPAAAKDLIGPGHEAELQRVLAYHLIAGQLTTADVGHVVVRGKAAITTLAGASVVIGGTEGHLQVNDAHVIQSDLSADNGIIQVIDAVLLPPVPVQPR